jgi:class 3 adenylate cyclase
VVVGASTAADLGDAARLQPMGRILVKGKQDPVEAFVLVGMATR